MKMVNMHVAKSNLSRLVESLARGEEDEIVIARNGKPAARLLPLGDGWGEGPAGRTAVSGDTGPAPDGVPTTDETGEAGMKSDRIGAPPSE